MLRTRGSTSALGRMKAGIGVLLLCSLVAGCFPVIHRYEKPLVNNGEFFREYCHGGAGPPSIVYFPLNEIYLAVGAEDVFEGSYNLVFGVSVPEGVLAKVLERHVSVKSRQSSQASRIELKPMAPEPGTAWILKYERSETPEEAHFEVVSGSSRKVQRLFGSDEMAHKTLLFSAPLPIKAKQLESITLPDISVNGQHIDGPTIKFKRSTNVELSPINC